MASSPTPPALSEFLRYLSLERGLSINTCKAYASDLKTFVKHLGNKDPLKVSSVDLSDYLWLLKSKRNLDAVSISRAMEALKSFYRFQLAEERIQEDPTRHFKTPHLPSRLPQYLTKVQVEAILREAMKAAGLNRFEPVRLWSMLEMLYATGMRVSELLSLKPADANLAEGWVRVVGKGSKERLIPMHERARAAMTRYLRLRETKFTGRTPSPEIFLSRKGKKLSRPQFWRDLRAVGRRVGVEGLHPHTLRHSFASHLLQGGADLRSLQEMLGHANLNTTQIYTHLEAQEMKNAHSRFHPRG